MNKNLLKKNTFLVTNAWSKVTSTSSGIMHPECDGLRALLSNHWVRAAFVVTSGFDLISL
jgi:hypothetical protein